MFSRRDEPVDGIVGSVERRFNDRGSRARIEWKESVIGRAVLSIAREIFRG